MACSKRYNHKGTLTKTLSDQDNILPGETSFNELENFIYGNLDCWFYLKFLEYNKSRKELKIYVYPNNNTNDLRHYKYQGVSSFLRISDEFQESEFFPQQIIGIDCYKLGMNEFKIILSCDEAEYNFICDGWKKESVSDKFQIPICFIFDPG